MPIVKVDYGQAGAPGREPQRNNPRVGHLGGKEARQVPPQPSVVAMREKDPVPTPMWRQARDRRLAREGREVAQAAPQPVAYAARERVLRGRDAGIGVGREAQPMARAPQEARPPEARAPAAHRAPAPKIPTAEKLDETLGRPKDDVVFGRFTIKKNSTHHKAFNAALDDYHAAYKPDDPADSRSLLRLKTKLLAVRSAADAYTHARIRDKKYLPVAVALAPVKDGVNFELIAIDKVLAEIVKGQNIPAGTSLGDVLAYARNGKSVDNLHPLVLLDKEAELLKTSGLGVEGGKLYREYGLPVTTRTTEGVGWQERQSGFKRLGAGTYNQVYLATFKGPDETIFEGVLKPLPPVNGQTHPGEDWSNRLGFDPKNPMLGLRNISARALDEALGLNLTPECVIYPLKAKNGDMGLGLLMTKAPGVTGHHAPASAFENGKVREALNAAAFFDALTFHPDRHGNNYLIGENQVGEKQVTLIDHDLCFSRNDTDPNGIGQFQGCPLPNYVGRKTYDAFMNLSDETVEACMEGHDPGEIAAAKQRLEKIKAHLQNKIDYLIEDDQWGSDETAGVIRRDEGGSYLKRDMEIAQNREWAAGRGFFI